MSWGLVAVAGATVLGSVVGSKANKKAAAAQAESSDAAIKATQEAQALARGDLFKLFPAAQQNLQQGFQGALDVFGQSLPAQTQVFQQGNVGAQQQLLSGLDQQRNALFGNQVDFSQLQPVQLQTPDLSFFQQQLPQFVDPFAPPTADQTAASMGTGVTPLVTPFRGGGGNQENTGFGSNLGFGGGGSNGFGGFSNIQNDLITQNRNLFDR